jgi:hypothetical protein
MPTSRSNNRRVFPVPLAAHTLGLPGSNINLQNVPGQTSLPNLKTT